MKKLFFKLAALVSLVAIVFGGLAGCSLFEVNAGRDMDQVAATVNIDGNADSEVKIYKRDMLAGYMSYGYYYVQQYGYTTSKAYQLVLNNLVNNEVIIASGKNALAGSDALSVTDVKSYDIGNILSLLASDKDVEKFEKSSKKSAGDSKYTEELDAYVANVYASDKTTSTDASFRFVAKEDVLKAISDAVDNVNSFIDSFMDSTDEEDDHDHEHISYTTRTVPTMETEEEKVDEDACKKIIKDDTKGLNAKVTGDRLKALGKGYKKLVELGLVTDGENYYEGNDKNNATVMSVMQLGYFKDSVRSAIDSKLVDKYEEKLRSDKIKDDVDYWEQYKQLKAKQESEYTGDISSLETALGNVSSSNFVVYNTGIGYGYVSHLVIEYTEEQKAKITKEKGKDDATKSDVKNFVNGLAKEIVVKDLRDTWVKSGYGTYDGTNFKFGKKYVYNTEGLLSTYQGNISEVTYYTEEVDDKEEVHFNFGKVTPTESKFGSEDSLLKKVLKEYLNVEVAVDNLETLDVSRDMPKNAYKAVDEEDHERDLTFEERQKVFNNFEDIKFAFSTDTGNFNKYFGYLYSPLTAADTYVPEFVDACTKAVAGGEGSVVMFMSESYGLHVLMCTAKAENDGTIIYKTEGDADKEKFEADRKIKGTVAYNFEKANIDLIESTYVSKKANMIIKDYIPEDGKDNNYVKHFNKVYKDLITE